MPASLFATMRRPLFACFLGIGVTACSFHDAQSSRTEAVRRYLSARTLRAAVDVLAPEYRLWFSQQTGAGISRETAAAMLQWDYALNVEHAILDIRSQDDVVVARVHEANDFSRLLDFPGWTATSTYTVDKRGFILSQLYVPDPGQPDWRTYVEPALAWIRQNRPEVLPTIWPDGKLARSAESAQVWVKVLREWRAATGRPPR